MGYLWSPLPRCLVQTYNFPLANLSFVFFFSVPPKSVTLGRPEPARAGELLQLACTAEDSNPKTTLVWYRGDNPIPDGAGDLNSFKAF